MSEVIITHSGGSHRFLLPEIGAPIRWTASVDPGVITVILPKSAETGTLWSLHPESPSHDAVGVFEGHGINRSSWVKDRIFAFDRPDPEQAYVLTLTLPPSQSDARIRMIQIELRPSVI